MNTNGSAREEANSPQEDVEDPGISEYGGRRSRRFLNRWSLLRLVVSVTLFGILFWKVDAIALMRKWRELDIESLVGSILLFEFSNLVGCIQWRALLAAQGLRPRTSLVFGSYHVALFFSNFLPGHYGGDAVRVYDIYRATGKVYGALAATFLDRLIGFVGLCLLAVAVAPFYLTGENREALGILLLIILILSATLFVLFSKRAARPLRFVLRPFNAWGFSERIRAGYDSIYLYRRRLRTLGLALGLSLVVQSVRVYVHYMIAVALGVDGRLQDFFLLIPILAIFIALPISINGIGVREGTGVILFQQAHLSAEGTFGFLFLTYAVGVIVSLSGGVIFALRGRVKPTESFPSEDDSTGGDVPSEI